MEWDDHFAKLSIFRSMYFKNLSILRMESNIIIMYIDEPEFILAWP